MEAIEVTSELVCEVWTLGYRKFEANGAGAFELSERIVCEFMADRGVAHSGLSRLRDAFEAGANAARRDRG